MSAEKLDRRRVLGLLGAGLGAVTLGACGRQGDGGGPGASASTTTTSTAAAGAAAAPSATPGGAITAAMFGGAASCTATVEQTAGPFYIDVDKIRGDVREDRAGTPLRVAVRVVDTDGCTPIEDAVFEIWHCDAEGLYSGFEEASTGAGRSRDDKRYLRGAQVTNAEGIAVLTTIFPGWYPGRTVHIHARVALTNTELLTTQLYFDDGLTDAAFEAEPYAGREGRRTRNREDGFYDARTTLTTTAEGAGYLGLMTIGVAVPGEGS